MNQHVRDAAAEWLAGIIIGVIPLAAHAAVYFASAKSDSSVASWTADVVFIVISTSGTSLISACRRLMEMMSESYSGPPFGKSLLALIAGTVLVMALAAIIYGAAAGGSPGSGAILEALGLLVASLVTSIYLELTLVVRDA